MYQWPEVPQGVRDQVEGYTGAVRRVLGENLVGIYLHGSLAIGCPIPVPKDIDLLFITQHGLSTETKRLMADLVLAWSAVARAGVARPLEVHFLSRENLLPWRHPTPYDFHYSEDWRGRLSEQLASGEWRTWNDRQAVDPDLAAHLTVTLHRGVTLFGPPPAELIPPIPPADYLAAIQFDVANAADWITSNPVYGVLNLCRVAWYVEAGKISSKEEAGHWGSQALPADVARTVSQALAAYRGEESGQFDPGDLASFVAYTQRRIAR